MSGINLKNKDFIEGMRMFEDDRKISPEFVIETLKEAIIKTYQKHIDAPAAVVRVEIDGKEMKIYHDLTVVEYDSDKFDETLDIELSEARKLKSDAKIGDIITEEVDFNEIGRSSISVAKNMLKQKIKEYEKQRVYDEYKDKEYDLISGIIKTVEEKFVLVDIKNTIGILLKSEQIPGEVYHEGMQIRAIIKEVSKNSKGSQVVLSRADAMFVKRLFEKEVPEISQGVVEIKAIAREAGERTKMAVYSRNEDIDPIGACIGPRGSRVQAVISEVKGEKIDVFEWNDDIGELVKNALSPAEVKACFYQEEDLSALSEEERERRLKRPNRPLIVVVDDDQLSVAIGKKGKNAKLAVKLTDRKIDIKTISEINEAGIDIDAKVAEFAADQERIKKEREAKKFQQLQEEALKRKQEFEQELKDHDTGMIEEVFDELEVSTPLEEEEAPFEEVNETINNEEEVLPETLEEENKAEASEEKVEEIKEEEKKEPKRKLKLEPKPEYKSKFEDYADASKREEKPAEKKRKRKGADEDRRLRAKDMKKDEEHALKVEYSEEELEEIRLQEERESEDSWINDDIDFDAYEDYYDKD